MLKSTNFSPSGPQGPHQSATHALFDPGQRNWVPMFWSRPTNTNNCPSTNVSRRRRECPREREWRFCTFFFARYKNQLGCLIASCCFNTSARSYSMQFVTFSHIHGTAAVTWFFLLGAPEQQLTSNWCFVATYFSRPLQGFDSQWFKCDGL